MLWLIVSPTAGAPTAPSTRNEDAAQVFACDFAGGWDTNFDEWPDKWSRARSALYPPYLKIGVSDKEGARKGRALKIQLDGKAALVYSPVIPINPLNSYLLEADIKSAGLVHDQALVSLIFLDSKQKVLETVRSRVIRGSTPWSRVTLGPISCASNQATFVQIGLHLEPKSDRADLTGSASFADIWLGSLPRMSLTTDRRDNIFYQPDRPQVILQASGFAAENSLVTLELLDVQGTVITRHNQRLEATKHEHEDEAEPSAEKKTVAGKIVWALPLPDRGFYRVRAVMPGRRGVLHEETVSLALIEPRTAPMAGEFGWSLPSGEGPLSVAQLAELVSQSGINWLKLPVWFAAGDQERAERLVWLADRLQQERIDMVGILSAPRNSDQPSTTVAMPNNPDGATFGTVADTLDSVSNDETQAANWFTTSKDSWFKELEPVLSRLSLKVRWWQLGTDHDTSFVGYRGLDARVQHIKRLIGRFGEPVRLGIGWSWLQHLPTDARAIDFFNLVSDPPLTADELAAYLSIDTASSQTMGIDSKLSNSQQVNAQPSEAGSAASARPTRRGSLLGRAAGEPAMRWVLIDPLLRGQYSAQARACDLALRMIIAKMKGAEGIFAAQVFDNDAGLMQKDGGVGELFLPWRTVALALSGTNYVGQLRLSRGSNCYVFSRGNDLTLVAWNPQPRQETFTLGEHVIQTDLWGRSRKPTAVDGQQQIEVGPAPILLTKVSAPLVRWQMSVKLSSSRFSTVFGATQQSAVNVTNPFTQSVYGTLKIAAPDEWRVSPRISQFKLAAGERLEQLFDVRLPFDVTSGRQKLRLDFEVTIDRTYKFSVYPQIEVGLGDIYADVVTRTDEHGQLEIEQRLHNETNQPVSFRCYLFIPDRQRMVNQVLDLEHGTDIRVFRPHDSEALIGKTLWLRLEEIDGDRVLNYRFVAQP